MSGSRRCWANKNDAKKITGVEADQCGLPKLRFPEQDSGDHEAWLCPAQHVTWQKDCTDMIRKVLSGAGLKVQDHSIN